ncbi:16320_t:CDS:2, partial [Racocetra fulgida]
IFVDPDYELATKELQQTLDTLHIQKNMEIHQQFSDEDFIQAATEIEHIENEVTIQPLTGKEQLDILCGVLRIVDEKIDNCGVTMRSLCKLQMCIREEVRKEEAENQ